MQLIVGLGNPGPEYRNTRHNVGFIVLDELLPSLGLTPQDWKLSKGTLARVIKANDTILMKPKTFMNESGRAVQEILQFYHLTPADLWVVHDDLDLPLGQVRLSDGSSAAGHRGVQSIIDILGTKSFKRFRFGIGRPTADKPAEAYVLEPIPQEAHAKLHALAELIKQARTKGFTQVNVNTPPTP